MPFHGVEKTSDPAKGTSLNIFSFCFSNSSLEEADSEFFSVLDKPLYMQQDNSFWSHLTIFELGKPDWSLA